MEQFSHINKDREYVKYIQKEVDTFVDGIYGPGTHKAVLEHYGNVIFHMGKVLPIEFDVEVDVSQSLYELDDGTKNWYLRKKDPSTICVHWGGLNSRHCYNVFNMARGRHVSSHFLLGYNHKQRKLEVLQCLDTGLVAYHAGKFNKHSIGIDICMHPQSKYWEKTKGWYPDATLEKYQGTDRRVPKEEIAMIGDRFSEFCRDFLFALRKAVVLDYKPVCKDNNIYPVKEATNYSIVGHHNISAKKWDVIPWAEKLYYNID
tara:strand:+ start:202 stop:981 length:780 start_codon:yes stop_codon:yes gene_type:complete